MSDENRQQPGYPGRSDQTALDQGASANEAMPPAQAQVSGPDVAANWVMEATEQAYRAGGTEGEFSPTAHGETRRTARGRLI